MKPQELRIGSIIKLRDTGEIAIVERISRKKVGFFRNGDKSRGYFRKYSEIEGVLIFGNAQSSLATAGVFWLDGFADGKWYQHFGSGRKLRFIHELQNLHYALTGEELTIEI